MRPACSKVTSTNQKVSFVKGDNKIDVLFDGKLFTSYRYANDLTKPILYPVYAPSGIMVNRAYPFAEVPGESKDHPHHTGIFFTYDEVNSDGFWNNVTSPPQIKHINVTEMKACSGRGKLSTIMHWVGKNGQTLLEEKRTMTFIPGKDQYAIDFSIDLTAKDTKVVFGDTKEGMFAIRVAPFLCESTGSDWVKDVTGTAEYLSSNGDRTEKNVWAKRAKWVRLEGQKDSKTVGIAIFNHPKSTNYPTYWHARGYGLFAANPLGQYVFETATGNKDAKPLNLTLQPGQSAHFAFRMLIYDGKRTPEQLEKIFDDYAK